jgi:magnesium transporter
LQPNQPWTTVQLATAYNAADPEETSFSADRRDSEKAMLSQESSLGLSQMGDLNQLKVELNALPAVDVGDYVADQLPGDRAIAFRLLKKDQAIDVFEYLPPDVQEQLLADMHNVQVCQIIENMRPDERVALFDELPAGVVKRLLSQLSVEERQATATILGYEEGTAGRLMTTEYVRLRQGLTVGEALAKMKQNDQDKESIYYAYVTDDNRKLLQVVSLRQLLFTLPDTQIKDIASDRVIKVSTETTQSELARLMQRYDLIAMPVVDREDRLVGLITIDDVVDVIEEEATEDIQKLAGVGSGDESSLSMPWTKIKSRLPWLLFTMLLYIGAATAITPFQLIISKIPVLPVLMPIFSNTGGTVGIQALTVTIRSLGVGEIKPEDLLKVLQRELLAALGVAFSLGMMMVLLGLLFTPADMRWVAFVAGMVMFTNTIVAVSLGTMLPMAFQRFKIDPALISGPLVTTLLDSIGFLQFLSMITLAARMFKLPT